MLNYLPYSQRTPNENYKNVLRDILANGLRTPTPQVNAQGEPIEALTLMGATPMRFRLENGFPMLTERDISGFWKTPIAEMLAFINGARTQEKLEEFGCKWWKFWATAEKCAKRGLETGDLGPGSYGAAFHDFPTAEGESFNQFAAILEQIKQRPELRTHFITPWIPQYTVRLDGRQQKVVVCPCHGWIHLRVIENKLILHMFQRSGDFPVGVPSNMIQYAALLLMLAQALDLEPYEYVHTVSDAHIYLDQRETVEEILARPTHPFPTVTLTNPTKDIFTVRKDDFELSDYVAEPAIKKIPVGI